MTIKPSATTLNATPVGRSHSICGIKPAGVPSRPQAIYPAMAIGAGLSAARDRPSAEGYRTDVELTVADHIKIQLATNPIDREFPTPSR